MIFKKFNSCLYQDNLIKCYCVICVKQDAGEDEQQAKAPVYTKFILMNCLLGNTNFLKSASSGLGYASFYIIPTDGATMYFKLGSGSGSGRIQTDY